MTRILTVESVGYFDFKLVRTTLYPSSAEPVVGNKLPVVYILSSHTISNFGSYIVFVSFEKNFYNGKMGRIESLSEGEVCIFFPEEKRKIIVEKYEWNNIRYKNYWR